MCEFGNSIGRYDFNYGWNPLWQSFFSPENAFYLNNRFAQLGYPNVNLAKIRPYMTEVISKYWTNGYDVTQCGTNQATLRQLNEDLIEYVVPIFENQKMSLRAYALDQKYIRPIDRAISVQAGCKHRTVLYNNRFL